MRKIKIIFFILCFPVLLLAKNNILLTVDSTNLVVGQSTNLTVTLSNISPDNKPEIENISNFNISFTGTSNSISIINGHFKSSKSFSYTIVPLKKGEFKIGPAVVTVKGKVFKSNTVIIKVSDSSISHSNNENKNIFLVVKANKRKVKLNEEIILDVKLYRRIDVYNMSIKVPDLNEFLITKLTNAEEYIEPINGRKYYVDELKYSLIPTETGEFTVSPFILYGKVPLANSPVDNFFKNPFIIGESKRISVASNSLKIKVDAIKSNVYAVGDYSIKYSIDKNRVKVGESITLTFKISGNGNLNFSQNLKLPEIDGLKYYPDKPQISVKPTPDGLFSNKVEKIAIIPEKAGDFTLPQMQILFFNSSNNKYEKYNLPSISFKVLPGKGNKLKVVQLNNKQENKNSVKYSEKSIETIITNKNIVNQDIKLSITKFFILYVIPLIILFLSFFIRYFYLFRRANYKKIIQSKAYNNFKKSIATLDNIENLSKAIKKYFSEKTGNLNHSYTFKEILTILENLKTERMFLEKLEKLFNNIEKVQFAKIDNIDISKFKSEIIEIIEYIDKKLEFK